MLVGRQLTKRRRSDEATSHDVSLLEAVEAITRTIRLDMLPEDGLPQALQRVLALHGHDSSSSTKHVNPKATWQANSSKIHQHQTAGATHPWNTGRATEQWRAQPHEQHKPSNKADPKQWQTATPNRKVALAPEGQWAHSARRIQAFITSEWLSEPTFPLQQLFLKHSWQRQLYHGPSQ